MNKETNDLVLMIMIDALRHDYINKDDAPFISSLADKGIFGNLQPSFGFEPDGAYFAGLHPDQCDGGSQFWYRPGVKLFHYIPLFRILEKLPSKKWKRFIRKLIRLITQIKSNDSLTSKMATSAYIPLEILGDFSTPMTHISSEPGFMPKESIFDIVRRHKMNFYYHGFPQYSVHTDKVLSRYLKEEKGGNKLGFLFFGDLDSKGHTYGPESTERRAELTRIDNAIKQIYFHASKYYDNLNIVIFGDHGMVATRDHIDLTEVVHKYFKGQDKDKYFLDSTMARFWIDSDRKREAVLKRLSKISGGRIVQAHEYNELHINYPHNYFGDIFFVADCGNLIHPSFYAEDKPPMGMHGYTKGCLDNEAYFLVSGHAVDSKGDIGTHDMRNIFKTIIDLANFDVKDDISDDLYALHRI